MPTKNEMQRAKQIAERVTKLKGQNYDELLYQWHLGLARDSDDLFKKLLDEAIERKGNHSNENDQRL